MIAVFLGPVMEEDYRSCDEGDKVIRVRFTPLNVQIKSPVDKILSDSKRSRQSGIKLQPLWFNSI